MKKTLSPLAKTYSPVSLQTALLPRLVEDWLLTCDINRCSERTIRNRRYLLGRLQWFLEDRKRLAYYRHFRTFFNYLVAQGDLEASPLDPIQKPINRPDQVQPFTEDQVKRILTAARHTTNAKRGTAIIYTLLLVLSGAETWFV